MIFLDVNVLVYGVNADAPQHEAVRGWLSSVEDAGEPIALAWETITGFLRLITNPRAVPSPLTREEAASIVDDWLEHANVALISPTREHWRLLEELMQESQATANLVTDAHLAAIAIGNAATLASCDADFARFRKLRWVNPLAPGGA